MSFHDLARQGRGCLLLVLFGSCLAATAADTFRLSSPDIKPGGMVPNAQVYADYGCTGKNISPALAWQGAPPATRSFAVTVFDPDARMGTGWWHWLIYDIAAGTTGLAENAGDVAAGKAPKGSVQSVNDFHTTGYGGPCPPPRDEPHHYVFTVYALDVTHLGLGAASPPEAIHDALAAHALAKASFTARYGR